LTRPRPLPTMHRFGHNRSPVDVATRDERKRQADAVIRELAALGDAATARGQGRFFKEDIRSLGVAAPAIRRLEKQMFTGVAKRWSADEALEFCELVLAERLLEPTLLALIFLGRFGDRLEPEAFDRAQRWLERELCDNWATVDTLCPLVLSPIVRRHPRLAARLKRWTVAPNRWLRRASAVALIKLAPDPAFHPAIFDVAARLLRDKEDDLVQKANGWLLRDVGRADRRRLEAFLLAHGADVPRTTLRYALEKFPAGQRNRLMTATRG